MNKVKSIFVSKTKQANFRSNFTPPKHLSFSHAQLKYLKLKCSEFLTTTLEEIIGDETSPTLIHNQKKKGGKIQVNMPQLFGDKTMTETILPMSFLSDIPSNDKTKCDLPTCKVDDEDEEWSILNGCWHSFHDVCLASVTCPLCEAAINNKIMELGNVAKDAILCEDTTRCHDFDNSDDEEEVATIAVNSEAVPSISTEK